MKWVIVLRIQLLRVTDEKEKHADKNVHQLMNALEETLEFKLKW